MIHRFGAHELRLVDDVAWAIFHGSVNLAELKEFTSYLEAPLGLHGYLIMVCDLADAGTMAPDGRHFMATWFATVHRVAIFINAGFKQRVLLTMVDRASELLRRTKRRNYFVNSDAEAEALVPVLRASLTPKSPTPKPAPD